MLIKILKLTKDLTQYLKNHNIKAFSPIQAFSVSVLMSFE